MSADESTLIQGVSIGGFRSFGQVQRIGPLSKINVFIGPNNSGKSNILLFLHRHWSHFLGWEQNSKSKFKFDRRLDTPRLTIDSPLVSGIGTSRQSKRIDGIRSRLTSQKARELLDSILARSEISHGTNLVWHDQVKATPDSRVEISSTDEATARSLLKILAPDPHAFEQLFQATNPNWRGGTNEAKIQHIIKSVMAPDIERRDWIFIPAVRQVSSAKDEEVTWCGAGIINRLAELQNPDHFEQEKKDLFSGIGALLKDVTGNDTAELDIPHHRKTILVHMDGKSLPLESLGTGIHELIIMAATCTTLRDQSVCIEEPEIHLNPLLQRKFIRYLFDKTNNQYFITSHSAALLDTEIASVYQLPYDGTQTTVQLASEAGKRWQICRDLGYKASDLMQANCVIWVEGPSDRIYLNNWIKAKAPRLLEGIHYSIMFYGGRLLSHFSIDTEVVDQFISMCHLNRNPAIVLDSDKSAESADINETKKRILQEFKELEAFSWLTAGREIENYFSNELFQSSVAAVAEKKSRDLSLGQFDKRVPEGVDKVRLARKIVESDPDFDALDLNDQVDNLVEYIRNANQ